MDNFIGAARALSADGLDAVCDGLSVKAAEIWAVVAVETSGCGYLSQRAPQILFERHKFHGFTQGLFDAAHPDLSNPVAGGYAGGYAEYQRLARAMALSHPGSAQQAIEDAALEATSWGLGQVMGFNCRMVGYADVRAMVAAVLASEDAQLMALGRFLRAGGLDGALRAHDWARVARGYNGADFARNSYDQRLAGQYAKFSVGPLPDLTIRAAQLYLTYLGYKPGSIDGVAGRLTIAALNAFQQSQGFSRAETIDGETVAALEQALSAPAAGHAEQRAA